MRKFSLPAASKAARAMLVAIGEDPQREGLIKTPDRVAKGMAELLQGYKLNPAKLLATTFDADGYNEMVTLRDVDFYSMCEHHMLPFIGSATLGYIPKFRVVGLSKLARLVDCFARRLQIQERMTQQIGESLERHLEPHGWGVVVRAKHLCMCARGVNKQRGEMLTSAVGGLFKSDARARQEFLSFAR